MKKSILILGTFLVFVSHFINAQQTMDTLNGNSVSAIVNDGGRLFQNPNMGSPGYEFPAGSGNHLIFSTGFWFGGTNQNGDLKLAAQLYGIEREYVRGPVSLTDNYLDTSYIYTYERSIWTVGKADIIYHVDNYNQPGYVASDVILNWPGNGNPSIGVAQQLAPYIDINNNGFYEPYLGDYPCIKGDMASYQILHENHQQTYSSGSKVGAEIHFMAYQVQSNDFIDSTTFIEVKVINRGQNSFNDFKAAVFMDNDIGFAEDDFIGSAPLKNLVYGYNGDNFDEGGNGAPGFTNNPPAIGFMSLNKHFEYSGFISRGDLGTPATDDPRTAADYWNYMNGKWKDGTEWTYSNSGYGGTIPVQHFYDGNPYLGTGWTELNVDGNGNSNQPGDRRLLAVTIEETFNPGDVLTYNYAIIVNQQGDHIENVQGLINYADSVQNYFDNTNYQCIQKGTGNVDVFGGVEKNLKVNFEITRLDGEGNMSRAVALNKTTEDSILAYNFVDQVKYVRGKGPIEARLIDTINHAVGHFVIKFNEYNDVDSANWTIYHYDTIGGNLLDSVNSNSAINIGNEQLFPQWGMAVRIKQENYVCPGGLYSCDERYKHALPLVANLNFENNTEWLTGVKNTNALTPLNWIRSGSYIAPYNMNLIDSVYDSQCYTSNDYDNNSVYGKLVDGIISPSIVARDNSCYLAPVVCSESIAPNMNLVAMQRLFQPTVYQPSIDIVFTDDTSKWTRSPVIELNAFDQGSVGGGKAGYLRKSNSVDKQGNPDGSGVGMGWFPGYAIDVETGRRLNIAFGENSTLTNDNGNDMIWNPTERIFDNNGNYVLGGQHVIYVYGRQEFGMPIYDEGAFIYEELSAETADGYRNVYANLSWVMQPLLKPGEQLNSSDARMSVRINKEFRTQVISHLNEGRPMFSWNAIPYDQIGLTSSNLSSMAVINIYPNPASNQINVVWNSVNDNKIKITSSNGVLVKDISINSNNGSKVVDVSGLSPGVYFVSIGNEVKMLVVQ